jgi:hypothetical protein
LDRDTIGRETIERKGREENDASQTINREKASERQFEEKEKNWEKGKLLLE